MEIRFLPSFKRAYRKLPDNERDHVDAVLRIFLHNPSDPRLHSHGLSGPKRGVRSLSAGYDLRILYVLKNDTVALLITVGTHEEVY